MRLTTIGIAALLLAVTACAHPGQNRYDWKDVGVHQTVQFGTLISAKDIEITGKNSGAGALVGAAAGMGGGSYIGGGTGNVWATLGAGLAGAVIGGMIEQSAADHQGVEYIVTLEDGETVTIVQHKNAEDEPLRKGARVMVQTSGNYRRVLPADDLPEEIETPKRIKVRGHA